MTTPQSETSLTLLEQVQANDRNAWRRLVALYSPLIVSWCGRLGVRREDTDDVLQEVWQATSTSLKSFRRDKPNDTFRGWLRGITRNVALLHYRRNGRHPRACGGTDALLQLQQVADGLELEDDSPSEISGLYHRALELVRCEFEVKTWQMFWATVIEGRAPVDIASEFGVTPPAVRKAKSRVLRRLKEEVGDLIA